MLYHCNLICVSPIHGMYGTGLSQMQLQKSPEQYQKIPKSVVVQHKIGVRMINKIGVRKIELNIICKIN